MELSKYNHGRYDLRQQTFCLSMLTCLSFNLTEPQPRYIVCSSGWSRRKRQCSAYRCGAPFTRPLWMPPLPNFGFICRAYNREFRLSISSPRPPLLSRWGLEGLWSATREPVNFLRTIRQLEEDHPEGITFLDLGPSGTLATFIKYIGIKPGSVVFPTITPWGGIRGKVEAFENAL
ncbi:MAG: hypothetical protein CMI16_01225 [Opitutaceae bacterium]|nr:hypothetical protein [Opitutaceae bacterium]